MKAAILLVCTFGFGSLVALRAQPSYYDSRARQNAEYKNLSNATNRAYNVPSSSPSGSSAPRSSSTTSGGSPSPGRSTSSPSKPVTGSGSGYSNWGSGDRVRRQQQAGARNDALIDAHNAKQERFDALASGIPRTPQNYRQLMKLALQAGFDDYTAGRILYQYSPEAHGMTTTEVIPVYPDATKQMEDEATRRYEQHNDPAIRAAIAADIVKLNGSYENELRLARASFAALQYAEASTVYARISAMKKLDGRLSYEHGLTLLLLGDGAAAQPKLQAGLEGGEGPAERYLMLGWAQWLQGNTKGAMESAGLASSVDPGNPVPALMQAALEPAGAGRDALLKSAASKAAVPGSLATMVINYVKSASGQSGQLQSLALLDAAVATDPGNLDLVELRYGMNKKLGRHKQADADAKILEQ